MNEDKYLMLSLIAICIAISFCILKRMSQYLNSVKTDAYWVGPILVRDTDGKILAHVIVRRPELWGYYTGATENDVVLGYISEWHAKRAAENKCRVSSVHKKEAI